MNTNHLYALGTRNALRRAEILARRDQISEELAQITQQMRDMNIRSEDWENRADMLDSIGNDLMDPRAQQLEMFLELDKNIWLYASNSGPYRLNCQS